MHIGWGELLVIVALILLVMGGKRLPELGRAIGHAVREFQDALRGKHDTKDDHQNKE